MHSIGCFFAFCGFLFAELADTHCRQQEDICRGGKAGDIDEQIEGIGHQRLHQRIHRQRTLKMRADKKHIEGLIPDDTAVEKDFVEDHCHTDGAGEYRRRFQHGLVFVRHVLRIQHPHTDGNHRPVADHRLNIDADGADKHVGGVEHHRRTGKQRKGTEIGT